MIARIVSNLRGEFKLQDILEVVGMSKSTYMYHQKRFNQPNKDQNIINLILAIRKENKDYGYRRVHAVMVNDGIVINKKRVQRIMGELGLNVTTYSKKSRKYNSHKGDGPKVPANLLNRRFKTSIPYQKITTDTTEFKYYIIDSKGRIITKKLYLDPFMDLFNSEILAYSISEKPSADGILKALKKTIKITNQCPFRRTYHSDRGWAYQMKVYSNELKKNKIFQSMSRKGNCYDNAVMENFFGLMKQEMYYGKTYHSYEELATAIKKYIKYYNEKRIKKSLNWQSPVDYRKNYKKVA